jgi:hypothetical protein
MKLLLVEQPRPFAGDHVRRVDEADGVVVEAVLEADHAAAVRRLGDQDVGDPVPFCGIGIDEAHYSGIAEVRQSLRQGEARERCGEKAEEEGGSHPVDQPRHRQNRK